MKAGSVTRRCACRDPETGKQYGKFCPNARKKGHGTVAIRQELPSTADGERRLFRRSGYATAEAAQADLDKVRALLAIPEKDDEEGREAVAALLAQVAADNKQPIPDYDETKRRLRTGQSLVSKMTVGEWLDEWLPGKRIRKTSRRHYESAIRVHLRPLIGHIPVTRLRVSHLNEMFAKIEENNDEIVAANAARRAVDDARKQATKRAEQRAFRAQLREMPPFRRTTGPAAQLKLRATLRAALNDAIAQQIITFNPAAHVEVEPGKRPKALVWTAERVEQWQRTGEKPSPVMVWTPEQTGEFLDLVHEDRLYGLYHLIAFRGLRRGEGCGLRWSDVDLDAKTATVATQLVLDGWDVEEGDPKTSSGARVVALDAETVKVLRTHKAQQAAERLEWGEAWINTGRVFTEANGTLLHPGKVSEAFEKIVRTSSLPPIRLHDLRHGAATLTLAGGAGMKTVQEMLGHSSITITSDIYTSVLPEVAHRAAEAAAKLVPRRSTGTDGHTSGTHEAQSSAALQLVTNLGQKKDPGQEA
ncbi:site-specific integrase [Lentzea sp. NEAU-D13]|uniref:Site-specific integrase n=1 Tax=Lentzea alba TaxID=2714351 RepID=A0A7C9RP89_9PSEU|nr:site-specific integrase [Lentzea alba]NGY59569.1 site-specific integrase [Lentzea alba]